MIFRLVRDGFKEPLLQVPAFAQAGKQIYFTMATEAGAETTIGGETEFVASLAEMGIRQGSDEADARPEDLIM